MTAPTGFVFDLLYQGANSSNKSGQSIKFLGQRRGVRLVDR